MKKYIKIITAVVILLGVIFMRPLSFYVSILSNGYKLTQIENYITTEETQHGKNILVIVNRKEESFNLIMLSNKQSFFWYIKKSGETSTASKPYSWLKWDKWLIEDNGDLSMRAHITIVFKKESKVHIDTDNIPSSLEWHISQFKEFSIVDIYTKTANERALEKLDITELVKF